jgi:hypothetical protein
MRTQGGANGSAIRPTEDAASRSARRRQPGAASPEADRPYKERTARGSWAVRGNERGDLVMGEVSPRPGGVG